MNIFDIPSLPPGARALRVGCRLTYRAREASPLVLLIKPQMQAGQFAADEKITATMQNPLETLSDAYGNTALRTTLVPGLNEFVHDALIVVPDRPDNVGLAGDYTPIERLPAEVMRYLSPSRYCDSDLLWLFARQEFGHLAKGAGLAQAICDWTHKHIEYRYGSGDQTLTARGAIERGYGVCRDFAHVMVALCRALDMPARYVAGHLPQLRESTTFSETGWSDIGTDFHAYVEVYLGGCWHAYDPRYHAPMAGRIKIAHGLDAVDTAFATFFGDVVPIGMKVWSYQVDYGAVRLSEPAGLDKSLHGTS